MHANRFPPLNRLIVLGISLLALASIADVVLRGPSERQASTSLIIAFVQGVGIGVSIGGFSQLRRDRRAGSSPARHVTAGPRA